MSLDEYIACLRHLMANIDAARKMGQEKPPIDKDTVAEMLRSFGSFSQISGDQQERKRDVVD